MNDELVKKIVSVGDLVEKMLINNIKLEHFVGDKNLSLQNENKAIQTAIEEMVHDVSIFEEDKQHLTKILRDQWDVLDKVHDDNLSVVARGEFALVAQKMNRHRVQYKNQINKKSGSRIELKAYGTQ